MDSHTLDCLLLDLHIFMIGNLLGAGPRLKLREAVGALQNVRFVVLSLLWGFVLCPPLAYALTKVIPLDSPYAIGMVLLGMAPCAPFLPVMVDQAHGDVAYAAAFMLLAWVVTVGYMPFGVPVMFKGLTASAWTIAKPLVLFLVMRLAIGIAIRCASGPIAFRNEPSIKKSRALIRFS